MTAETIVALPLSTAVGVEIRGIDLGKDPSESAKQHLNELLATNNLLLFRDQELTEEQQLRACEIFGQISTQGKHYAKTPVRYVSNVDPEGIAKTGALTFHMDQSYSATPSRLVALYALEVPPSGFGGDTLFASMKAAYGLIPPSLRSRLEGMQALHLSPNFSQKKHVPRYRDLEVSPDSPRAIHPVIRVHPESGENVLYIDRQHVDCIFGLPEAESEALIEQLLSCLHHPEHIYTHQWKPQDLIVWDNTALQHARTDFDTGQRRHLRRTQIA